ncbi:Vms1/Ankzf1 family peptidyl-tRNA hydrolase [Streptomyces tremellae]|uniref:Vms1/Ankzf1 family peptidyl-tRNA hydrolase n=1 Tax=Streptomyces tremellae TaxID=1124239 RepID=A0ABP7FCM6_9ACTN
MNLAPLAPLYERPGPWASVYVDASAADQAPNGRRELLGRQVCDDLAARGADEATCKAVRGALDAYAADGTDGASGSRGPGGHGGSAPGGSGGLAIFATDGEVVLEPPLTLAPATETAVSWGQLPHVAPLLELAPPEPRCLVAYIDRIGADFELRTPTGRGRPLGSVDGEDWPVHRTATSEWDERHFQLSVENTWEQNARTTADALTAKLAETGADLVLLAGDDRERRTVRVHLPRGLKATVVESPHGGRAPGADSRLLDEDVAEAMRAYAEDRTAEELDRFRAGTAASGGRADAAEGVPALVEAAREHRIGTLFLQPDGSDANREVWAGAAPDQLAMRRTDTRYLGAPEPFSARADDALIRAATMTGAEVVLVRPAPDERGDGIGGPAPDRAQEDDDEALRARQERARRLQGPTGGLGALLRWPYATSRQEEAPESAADNGTAAPGSGA